MDNIFFYDRDRNLRNVVGNLDIGNKAEAKKQIYRTVGVWPDSAVLKLVVDNKPTSQPLAA